MSIFEWVPTLLLIFAVWQGLRQKSRNERVLYKKYWDNNQWAMKYVTNQIRALQKKEQGQRTKMYISAKIAEKIADRAFNMASSANLGVIAMQKALVQPRLMTKEQLQKNQLAKKQIDEIFSEGDEVLNMLRPVASEEELEVIDKILEDKQRKQMNGEAKS